MDNAYQDAKREHISELTEQLAEIAQLMKTEQAPSGILYRAAERSLQLLIEACIGIAKQSLKGLGKEVPSDARQAFQKLRQSGLDNTNAEWNKIIGMRNALVHDYLNLDPEIITSVIKDGSYKVLIEFAKQRLA